MMAASPVRPHTKRRAKPAPSRLAVYFALCDLSPAAYGPLARMITSIAEAERDCRTERRNRRYRTPGTVHADTARPGA
jgi:hypothetical protein